MKSFAERNPIKIGAFGVGTCAIIAVTALQYDKIPLIQGERSHSAYFSEAGGLQTGAAVQVAGFKSGKVSDIKLEGAQVLITFDLDEDVHLGDRTEAAIKTKSLLGAKVLEIMPRGDGDLSGPIPADRTTPPYQLPDALGDLSRTVQNLDTTGVSDALATVSETFKDTPPQLKAAVDGLSRFSQVLAERDDELRSLLANANKATTVLAERTDKVVALINDTNNLLAALREQSNSLDQLSGNISALAQQVSEFVADNKTTLRPALDKLNAVLTIVDNRRAGLQQSIKYLNSYAMSLGESVASGPFFKAYIANLLPGQFVQPFIDAAFSDLGVDPNVLLPSERTDPEVGQAATPPLPVPFPRTGQGGEPRRNLPDAITGNPGDLGCGPPGVPLPGPTGCYPYRDPAPAPTPGGPPPGPPAEPVGPQPSPEPTPAPIYSHDPHDPAPASGTTPAEEYP
ncbi:Uncharacterised protein [Mycolicibacterium vanbaalenii]|uniref:Uncharacterized protein n=1 Tax=Mycolicibacterium vanbaalenii TaxID=110539 RepID=A0A5S9R662_MYCVN|nr:MCE family protein [Mycolicibacterium vanbaalenii]CAA0129883.1 Uncharacterised protein [Mycolicibacterium vanbaalenii]